MNMASVTGPELRSKALHAEKLGERVYLFDRNASIAKAVGEKQPDVNGNRGILFIR